MLTWLRTLTSILFVLGLFFPWGNSYSFGGNGIMWTFIFVFIAPSLGIPLISWIVYGIYVIATLAAGHNPARAWIGYVSLGIASGFFLQIILQIDFQDLTFFPSNVLGMIFTLAAYILGVTVEGILIIRAIRAANSQ